MSISKLGEMKRLKAIGLAIHWLRPNSKVPVESGWSSDSSDTMAVLAAKYKKGFNIGTKLGKPSEIGDCYLAVIDVDVKGLEKRHKSEAKNWVVKNIPGLIESAPITHSGRGNGSMHVWCLVQNPMDSRKLTQSSEIVKVHMPSVTPSRNDKEKLSKKEIAEGFRMRPAWEVDFMCSGRQVVLPPSIHPDTGKEYKWGRPIEGVDSFSIITRSTLDNLATAKASKGRPEGGKINKFEIKDVSELELEMKLAPEVVEGIIEGDDVEDRSAYCLTVALSMVRAKFTDAQILGVLTNRNYFIGDCAFQHAKTSNRNRAARWAFDYCVRKARSEADAAQIFKDEVKVYKTLSKEKSDKQLKRIVTDLGQVDWRKKLDRTDNDKLKPTLKNVILVLQNNIGETVFMRDQFAYRDFYGLDTEWGGKKGESLTDDDAVQIKTWFANKWKIEPNVSTIFEAMIHISIRNAYHPVRSYLESLEWDGVPRVNTWLKEYLGASGKEPYLSEVSRKFLVAAVARVFNPGVKFDHMLILEGLQGIGKSTVGRILAGEKWFLDSLPDLTDKDAALNLQGIWLCEMGELVNLRRSDVEITKSFITRQIDKVRPPYGKRYIESYRSCVFFGTTNAEEYLKDKTGNRRFWPVKVTDVDFEGLAEDRDQLWAEAMFIYDIVGEKLYLEDEAKALAEEVQSSRVVEDEADVIHDKLKVWKNNLMKTRKEKAGELGKALKPLKFQTVELFEDFSSDETGHVSPLKDFKNDNYRMQLASAALLKLGFLKVTINGRKWWRIEPVLYSSKKK